MSKKISKSEKDKRWLALQKTRMAERIKDGLPVFDGRLVRIPLINKQYGIQPETEQA